MSLRIVKAGLMDTIQDMGRYGSQHLGINPGGAMDRMAMAAANILTGNPMHLPVLEMHFPAAEIEFTQPALLSITGGDFSATLNGCAFPPWRTAFVDAGCVLRFTGQKQGARVYLAAAGGLAGDLWLGSYSTNDTVKAGGYHGRALRSGDSISLLTTIQLPAAEQAFQIMPWEANSAGWYGHKLLRFTEGAEYRLLANDSAMTMTEEPFRVTAASDRMGCRIEGKPLSIPQAEEMISSAVTEGTIQLLPSGQLIILTAGHQTTGGYPRIAHVISADLPTLAQLRPGDTFHLAKVSIEDAEQLLVRRQSDLRRLQNACNFRLGAFFNRSPSSV